MAENDPIKEVNNELEPEQKRKVFIGSLSYRIDENTFREYWTQFGNVLDAMILRDREGRSRGFGFVTFDHSSSVDAVMKARPHTLDNRVVEPKRAVPREESHKPEMQLSVKKLYIGGVKEPISDIDLREYFSNYGTVTDVNLMKDRDGKYRGFAFVEFDDYDPVDKVILAKNHIVSGQSLDVQKAQMRDGSQRVGGRSMRGRIGAGPSAMSRSNYNDPFGQMSNQNDFYEPDGAPFGQGYGQNNFNGPMRRGNYSGHGYAPYNNRGRAQNFPNQGPSWTSWN